MNKTLQEILARRRLAEAFEKKEGNGKKDDKKPEKKMTDKELETPKGNKTLSGMPANEIETEPSLQEVQEQADTPVVMTFGRMNPPTIGHQVLVDKVKAIAKKEGAVPRIYLSQTTDKKKNPLHYDAKIAFARQAFGDAVHKANNVKTFFDAVKDVNRVTRNVIVVVGSDRVSEIKQKLEQYNGRDYNFSTLKVVSAGERDPDDEGAAGMSASKLRQLARDDQFEKFKQGLPEKLRKAAQTIYKLVRLEEEQTEIEAELSQINEALTTQQRIKRAIQLRRIKSKINVGRRRALKRRAPKTVLERRARRAAIRVMRQRLLRNRKYEDLPLSARAAIDARLKKRKKAIDKLAKRLLPRVVRAETSRKLGSKFKSISDPERAQKKEEPKKETQKESFDHSMMVIAELYLSHLENGTIGLKEQAALSKKAELHGMDVDLLEAVYLRGIDEYDGSCNLTQEQYAFNRVNSFISGGAAADLDSDLIQQDI